MPLPKMPLCNMTLIDLFRQVVAARPHDVAAVSSRGTCTYAELSQRARRVSACSRLSPREGAQKYALARRVADQHAHSRREVDKCGER